MHNLIYIIAFSLSFSSYAATQLEHMMVQKDFSGRQHTLQQTVLLSADKARLTNNHTRDFYMLMDMKAGKVYNVNTKYKQAVVLDINRKSDVKSPSVPQPAVRAELHKKGEGPRIAGFATQHYQIIANGQLCSDEYIASKALDTAHVKQFLTTMFAMLDTRRQAMPLTAREQTPCLAARSEVAQQVLDAGVPLRTVDRGGVVTQEVLRIQTEVTTQKDEFELPTNIQIKTEAEMKQAMQARMRQLMQQTGRANNPFQQRPAIAPDSNPTAPNNNKVANPFQHPPIPAVAPAHPQYRPMTPQPNQQQLPQHPFKHPMPSIQPAEESTSPATAAE